MNLANGGGISFEFFPPSTDSGEQVLWQAIGELEGLTPDFVSVTYGAGGSTRDRTIRITKRIKEETKLYPVAHLTCVGATKSELADIVAELQQASVSGLMALRGDPQGGIGQPWQPHPDGFDYAVELVSMAANMGVENIGVAAFPDKHPLSPSKDFDVSVLKAKQEAGAKFAVTQLFFDLSAYFELLDRCLAGGVTIPIRPGIMPLTDQRQIDKFSQLAGAPMPKQVLEFFSAAADSPSELGIRGIEFATKFAQDLMAGGAPGVHLYTMNRSTAAKQVCLNLRS